MEIMSTTSEFKKVFNQISEKMLASFDISGINSGEQVTPPQLIDAMNQFFIIFEKLDNDQSSHDHISKDEISQMGEHAIGCLMDLSVWADRLKLPKEKAGIDQVALGTAHWLIQHRGEIRILEPIVNALAIKANTTENKEALIALFHVISDVIEHSSSAIKSDLEKSDPTRPWRILNLNFAIVATRSQNTDLMVKAFDRLGHNLPEDCPSFFEEGLKQAEKPSFGPEIKTIMKDYFSKWTTRH
ncbi:hypothetical protein EDC63_10668 [Sulfurirhabdus autotrophica]|uniref:Uncharacterized protein n=2 Tax=Sulfurirhabdus autotrophica TaxID=1706046 RepID=A0A4R3Y4R7_9PROT|nr:hypothetical protein EDC63_10668 [Sulfurirhabdus autotrophica]